MKFLVKMTEQDNVKVTMMDANNLAIVFSPGFFRCADPSKMMVNTSREGQFVRILMESYGAQ